MALTTRALAALRRKLQDIDVTRDLVDWLDSFGDGTGLADGFLTLDHITNGLLTAIKLAFQPLENLDQYGYGYIRFVGDGTADADTVTIDGRAYEYTPAGVVTVGDVAIDMALAGSFPTPYTDADSATFLAATINADALRTVDAIVGADGESVIFVERDGTTGTFTIATIVAGAVVSGAVSAAGQAAQDLAVYRGVHTVTAENVLKLALGVTDEICIGTFDDPTGAPANFPDYVAFYDANGVDLPVNTYRVRVAQVNTDNYAILLRDPAGAARLALNSEIYWQVTVPRA